MKKETTPLSKIASLVITPLQGLQLEELLEFKPILELVRQEVSRGIERAIKGSRVDATIIEINNSGYYIEIPHKFWRNALNSCIEYYSDPEVEDFEKCLELKRVLGLLDEYDRIPTTQRKKSKKK